MKTTIASTEFYGVTPGGERKRLTVAVGTPVRDRHGEGWQCKVTIADVLRPTAIGGADSFEALARAVARVRQHLAGLQEEGWEFSLDRGGREVLDLGSWAGRISDTPGIGPFVQAAYFVPDAEAAARRWARDFGAGPFFLLEHIPLENVVHRGAPASLDHTSAYGQLGGLMIELVQQHTEHPSVFRDVFAAGETGLHHMAYFTPDLDAELARLRGLGYATAMTASTALGLRFAFADTVAELGHMLEIYEDSPAMRGFYAMVADATQDWDGADPVRSLG